MISPRNVLRSSPLVAAVLFTVAVPSEPAAQPKTPAAVRSVPSINWKPFDVDKSGAFDSEDVRKILGTQPFAPSVDANGDGKKDSDDAFALPLLLTQWDVHADGQVDARDALPPQVLPFPEPDEKAAQELVTRSIAEAAAKLPKDLDAKLKALWGKELGSSPDQLAALFAQAGASGLVLRRIEAVQWGFARAAALQPKRASYLSSLGFALAQAGRDGDALLLYARARQLDPKNCANLSNIGSIFSRRGQQAEATRFFREAVAACPQVGQYRINLGASLLRQGQQEAAARELTLGSERRPGDFDVLVLSLAAQPRSPPELGQYKAEYEKTRKELHPDERPPPWDEIGGEDQINEILGQARNKVSERYSKVAQDVAEAMKSRLQAAAKGAIPEWKDACADADRWNKNVGPVLEQLGRIYSATLLELHELELDYARQQSAAELREDQVVLKLALAEAQKMMTHHRDSGSARRAFEERVDELYTRRMKQIARDVAKPQAQGLPNEPHYMAIFGEIGQATIMSGVMGIPGHAFTDIPYAKTMEKCKKPLEGSRYDWKPGEPAFGVQLGILGLEFKPGSCEVKVQAGVGIMGAATWSPKNGFGMQVGYGAEVGVGAAKVGATEFIKFGTDGSITDEVEVGAGVGEAGGGGWQQAMEHEYHPADVEPLGSWGWAAEQCENFSSWAGETKQNMVAEFDALITQ